MMIYENCDITSYDLRENYYALMVSILTRTNPEQAFELLKNGKKKKTRKGDGMAYAAEMLQFRNEGYKYYEIAEIFGVDKDTAFRRIKNQRLIESNEM